ncbi:hypothetical protein [Reticulibacter mediterranei]|uniref:hypothetical protein n=1 Tax=Reticulibacter mediterranei TaxID=2778369 RepID=UPI001C68A510|nr:hypothetical protein [Reticulibacter mediterranei]
MSWLSPRAASSVLQGGVLLLMTTSFVPLILAAPLKRSAISSPSLDGIWSVAVSEPDDGRDRQRVRRRVVAACDRSHDEHQVARAGALLAVTVTVVAVGVEGARPHASCPLSIICW